MPSNNWTDTYLEDMLMKGDPQADAVIAGLVAAGDVRQVSDLMRRLVENDGLPAAVLPPAVLEYLSRTSTLPPINPEKIKRGEAVFENHFPEIITVLGFYSL